MGRLKPIGSEKLTGEEKIKRMLEIARFKETAPSNINETFRTEFNKTLSDGNNYEIVKERQGYVLKRTISESHSEYIEPMKNRKYYSSYSQALKRLNLLAGELNRLNENKAETPLFGINEDKGLKYILKPLDEQPQNQQATASAPPAPPPVPSPELPPAPAPAPEAQETPDVEAPSEPEIDSETGEEGQEEEKVTFRTIQKLTGKLTQKIRVLNNDEGMTSEDIKYVLNMVLSSLELGSLSEEDKEDIIMKIEESGEDMGMEDMGGEDMGMEDMGGEDMGMEDMGGEDNLPVPPQTGEMTEMGRGAIFDSIFGESKVDKVLSKYFDINESEQKEQELRKKKRLLESKIRRKHNENFLEEHSSTVEQELASKKFLQENKNYKLIGRTNKGNLVFEYKDNQVKITKEGVVI